MTGGFGPPCVGTWERCAPVGGARPCQEDWRRHSRPPVTGRASPPPLRALPRPPPQGVLERAAHGSRRGVEGPGPYEDGTLGQYFNIRYRAGPGRAGLVYTQWRWRARMHRAPPSAPSGGYCPTRRLRQSAAAAARSAGRRPACRRRAQRCRCGSCCLCGSRRRSLRCPAPPRPRPRTRGRADPGTGDSEDPRIKPRCPTAAPAIIGRRRPPLSGSHCARRPSPPPMPHGLTGPGSPCPIFVPPAPGPGTRPAGSVMRTRAGRLLRVSAGSSGMDRTMQGDWMETESVTL